MHLNVLSILYAKMLPKLGMMKTFPITMRSIPTFLDKLNIKLLKVEAIRQLIHHLVSLYSANTATKLLLKMIIEYHQIELDTDRQIFKLYYKVHDILTTLMWIISL